MALGMDLATQTQAHTQTYQHPHKVILGKQVHTCGWHVPGFKNLTAL